MIFYKFILKYRIKTPTFGDDDWKSKQLHTIKDKYEENQSQAQQNEDSLLEYNESNKIIQNNSSIIYAAKSQSGNDQSRQIKNNENIGLQIKLGLLSKDEQNTKQDISIQEEKIQEFSLLDNSSILSSTLKKTPQLGAVVNQNDYSQLSINDLDSLDIGIGPNSALKHPKISKKSPLFEKFGQQPQYSSNSNQKTPESNRQKNNNLSAYNFPSFNQQNGIYSNISKYSSNIYNSCNNSPSNLQNSESSFSDNKMRIQSDHELQDNSPKKHLQSLYNYQINSGRSVSDRKQLSHRQMNPTTTKASFNLRNNSDANITQNFQNQKYEQNLKLNLNFQSSFLPQIDKTLSIQKQPSVLNTYLNEIKLLDRGLSDNGSQTQNGISKQINLQKQSVQNTLQPLKKINSIDDQSLQNCFASIKASSPIKKNRIDIFSDFSTNVTYQSKTIESEHFTTQQNVNTLEDNFSVQLDLNEGKIQNLIKLNGLPNKNIIPPNTNQDILDENSSKKQKQILNNSFNKLKNYLQLILNIKWLKNSYTQSLFKKNESQLNVHILFNYIIIKIIFWFIQLLNIQLIENYLFQREQIRKGSKENNSRLISFNNQLEFLRKKTVQTTPQTADNSIRSYIQNTSRDENADNLLNLQFEKIEIKKQISNKISYPYLDFQELKNFNTIQNDEPADEIINKFTINQQNKIQSQRSRKPNSVHIYSSEQHKRAESAKNKNNQNTFQNTLTKIKYEPESARFKHAKRKISQKLNDFISDDEKQEGNVINLQSKQNKKQNEKQGNDDLYNPQQYDGYKATQKIVILIQNIYINLIIYSQQKLKQCSKIKGMFYKQKEIYEQKYKRKMTANKEEIDLLQDLNSALEELKSIHKNSSQMNSARNNKEQDSQNKNKLNQ